MTKKKKNNYTVYQHTNKTNGKVYIFESQKAAAEYVGIKKNMVSQFLNGYCKDKTGRGWCYA